MAFPQIVQSDIQNLEGELGAEFDITLLPSLTTGNLLLVEVTICSAIASGPMDLGSGWELVARQRRYDIDTAFYGKVAEAADSGSVVTAVAADSGWIQKFASVTVMEISGWSGTIADIASGSRDNGMDTTLSPASVSIASADDVLWIAGLSAFTSSEPTVTAPGSYTEVKNYVGPDGLSHLCYVQANAAILPSDNWTLSSSVGPVRVSLAIPPGDGATFDPVITLDQSEIALGGTLTGTATNFPAQPTSVTLSDGERPDYVTSPTFTPDGDDWDFSAPVENFVAEAKAAGAGNSIQRLVPGTYTVTVE